MLHLIVVGVLVLRFLIPCSLLPLDFNFRRGLRVSLVLPVVSLWDLRDLTSTRIRLRKRPAYVSLSLFLFFFGSDFNGKLRVVRRRRLGPLLRLCTVTQGHRCNRLYERACIKVAIIVVHAPNLATHATHIREHGSEMALTWHPRLDAVHQVNAIMPIIICHTDCIRCYIYSILKNIHNLKYVKTSIIFYKLIRNLERYTFLSDNSSNIYYYIINVYIIVAIFFKIRTTLYVVKNQVLIKHFRQSATPPIQFNANLILIILQCSSKRWSTDLNRQGHILPA